MFIDVLLDTFLDCLKMLPFLLAAYFLIEYLERHASEKLEKLLGKAGLFGFLPGAVLGLVPQCGFSGMAANLYASRVITTGTLVAVFLSTSDEAVPLMLAMPERWKELIGLLLLKFFCACLAGFITDFVLRYRGAYGVSLHEVNCNDHHEHEGLLGATLRHTGLIMVYIFGFLLLINFVTEWIGSEAIETAISQMGVFQIFASALVGLIPNCGSSVLLTQMYAAGQLSFAALFAGLASGSGIGTLVLLKSVKKKSRALKILGLMYGFGAAFGMILYLIENLF